MKIRRLELVIVPQRGRKQVFAVSPLTVGKKVFAAYSRLVNAMLPALAESQRIKISLPFPK